MPLYPSQTNQTPKAEAPSSPTKQALIIITLTLILIITWIFYFQLSYSLLTTIIPVSEFPILPLMIIPSSLSLFHLGLIILFIYSLFLALISLSALFITNRLTQLIPILIPPFTFILFTPEVTPLIITLFLAIFLHFLFLTSVSSDLKLYKNISLSRLVLPHTGYLFISLSLILVLPTFFYLQYHPNTIPQLIQTKLIHPVTNQIINSLPTGHSSTDTQSSPEATDSNNSSLIPPQFSHLISQELLNKFQPQVQPQATQSATQPSLIPNLNRLSFPTSLDTSQLSSQVQTQVLNQVNQILAPIYPLFSYLISFAVFFSIYQIASLLRPIIFIIPWLIFQFCLQLKIAKIITQNEPVQKLAV